MKFAVSCVKGERRVKNDKKARPENSVRYSWSGIGKLEIILQGQRTAVLRFDPDTGAQGRTEAAKSPEEETILQHQEN